MDPAEGNARSEPNPNLKELEGSFYPTPTFNMLRWTDAQLQRIIKLRQLISYQRRRSFATSRLASSPNGGASSDVIGILRAVHLRLTRMRNIGLSQYRALATSDGTRLKLS